jgi:ubiquinone/menaquinone biosynthesis C-methylase UbiE
MHVEAPLTPSQRAELQIKSAFFPESDIDNFSRLDGTLMMYAKVNALLRDDSVVLDFGAGRGANISECPSVFLKKLQTFKGRCAASHGCDIDEAVLENPYIDEARILGPDFKLPYDDNMFDLITSSWVFEHVEDAGAVADELLRVLKPGGTICARTPNKNGYISMASRMVDNTKHTSFLKKIHPFRKEEDVFPTFYRMNTPRQLQNLFGSRAEVLTFIDSADPSYHFNKKLIYRLFVGLPKILPSYFATTLFIFIRKK